MKIQMKMNNTEGKADLSKNTNIASIKNLGFHSTQYQGRTPLEADLSKAGPLNRARDYVNRATHPHINRYEPLPKDPEPTPNLFSAESQGGHENLFQSIYNSVKDRVEKLSSTLDKYNPVSSKKKQNQTYNQYDNYNNVQYKPEGEKKDKGNKNKISSLVEALERKAEKYFRKSYDAHRKDDSPKVDGVYEAPNVDLNSRPYLHTLEYSIVNRGNQISNPNSQNSNLEERVMSLTS